LIGLRHKQHTGVDNRLSLDNLTKVTTTNASYELLPYHRMGQPKYQSLGREYPLGNVMLSESVMRQLAKSVEEK
jgi:pyruvate-formate lyase-activating enzyme